MWHDFALDVVTGGPPPSAPPVSEREPWRDGNGDVCARTYRFGQVRFVDWPGVGVFEISGPPWTARGWPAHGIAHPAFESFFNIRLKPLVLQLGGCEVLHGSGIARDGVATALVGRSGTGKSTLGFAMHHAGFQQVADDAIVIDSETSPPHVRILPFEPQVHRAVRETLAADSTQWLRAPVGTTMCLGLILLLERHSEVGLSPVSTLVEGPAACLDLLTHAHVFDAADDSERLLTGYARLADAVPVVRVSFRPDLGEIDVLTREIAQLVNLHCRRGAECP